MSKLCEAAMEEYNNTHVSDKRKRDAERAQRYRELKSYANYERHTNHNRQTTTQS